MCEDSSKKQTLKPSTVQSRIHIALSLGLTFAGLHAFKPPVFHISVPGCSAVLVPSTAGSATTHSTGFFERATLWALHGISDRRSDRWRAD